MRKYTLKEMSMVLQDIMGREYEDDSMTIIGTNKREVRITTYAAFAAMELLLSEIENNDNIGEESTNTVILYLREKVGDHIPQSNFSHILRKHYTGHTVQQYRDATEPKISGEHLEFSYTSLGDTVECRVPLNTLNKWEFIIGGN